jgi:catechol 2,3-dioxygenase-like lactoylglutathione lyase family enzyme
VIDHVYISVTDVARSLAFYVAALKPLGWRELGNYDSTGGPAGVPDLYGLGDAAYGSGDTVGSSIWLRQRQPGETGQCASEYELARARIPKRSPEVTDPLDANSRQRGRSGSLGQVTGSVAVRGSRWQPMTLLYSSADVRLIPLSNALQ